MTSTDLKVVGLQSLIDQLKEIEEALEPGDYVVVKNTPDEIVWYGRHKRGGAPYWGSRTRCTFTFWRGRDQ